MMKVVPDTSVVVDGRVSTYVVGESEDVTTVLMPEAVVEELEAQANNGVATGVKGLSELRELRDIAENGEVMLEFVGEPTTPAERADAGQGSIDRIIRRVAGDHDATLLTGDVVQSDVAHSKGIDVTYLEPETTDGDELQIEGFFNEETMSVHLKTGTQPKAKRGSVGEMRYEPIGAEETDADTMRGWADEIEESVHTHSDSFMDLSEPGMSIVQYKDYRIAVARPPFADTIEITAVRPVAKTELGDYEFADEFRDRFLEGQRGVLIAGAPGAGKSTFAQAVGEFLHDNDYVVKTMEKPRDLQVGSGITQYTELGGEMEKTADSLLLVRPDYTIYDEIRKTEDFGVFSDMRLAGVGMVGVVHATRAIDALQRLVGRVELGMIPQVVDTVVYIEAGEVHTIYDVETAVKIPEGMESEDLARPVIEVTDFSTEEKEYELYTFNQQVITSPLDDVDDPEGNADEPPGVYKIAAEELESEVRSLTSGVVHVEVSKDDTAVVYVEESDISHVIGSHGSQIQEVEDRLGMHIDVRPLSDRGDGNNANSQESVEGTIIEPEINRTSVELPLNSFETGDAVEVLCEGDYVLTATVSHDNRVAIDRESEFGEILESAVINGHRVHVKPN